MHGVTITELIEKMHLRNSTPQIDTDKIVLTHPDVNRPALQLTGFFDHFDRERVQIIGYVEQAYIKTMERDVKRQMFDKLTSSQIPCLVFSRSQEPDDDLLEYCNYYGVPCLVSDKTTSSLMAEVIRWLKVQLAPTISIHGVLVDVFGEGVLIMGESGIGKSEAALELIKRGHRLVTDDVVEIRRLNVKLAPCISIHGVLLDVFGEGVLIMGESGIGKSEAALELIKRGHRLVTDDVVEIRKVSDDTLIGSAPDITRHFIELRGIGIIDVKTLYGVESVKDTQSIDMVIKLEDWNKDKEYDRLGLEDQYTEFLGNKVVCHTIPIRPGRNLAIIVESAAVNYRQKKMGYNAAQELYNRVQANLKGMSPSK